MASDEINPPGGAPPPAAGAGGPPDDREAPPVAAPAAPSLPPPPDPQPSASPAAASPPQSPPPVPAASARIESTAGAESARMPLLEHLKELRGRLIRSVIAIAVGFLIAYFRADWLFAALTWPLHAAAHGKTVLLIGTGVGEAFFTKMKVALIAGLFIASPVVFYEIWKFIAPGLYESERRMALPFVLFATIFFLAGGYFCWAVVFKIGYAFFLDQYASIGVTPTLRISEYLAFSAKLLIAFAITFEMPIFAFFLTRLGLIDYRMMIKYFRYAVLAIFVVAVALTPPDMVSPFLLAAPLLALYGLSVLVAYFFRARQSPAEGVAGAG
ncbi:MAG: twin-arginine translocase subunit TatC [Candidatus Binataceae bacterium]|nr:twin-arginine translocase subunit TatC [Candidatus Binataceae bacterium]